MKRVKGPKGNPEPLNFERKKLQNDMIKKTVNLTDHRVIHQFRGTAGNIYIVEDRRKGVTCLVDCVCTHFHVDHVSGWICLKNRHTDCKIWFHEAARSFVAGDARIPLPSFVDIQEILIPCMKEAGYFPGFFDLVNGGLYGTPFKKRFPLDRVTFFSNEPSVLPGFTTIHTPGHRPDSVSFFDADSGILICGDLLMVIDGKLIINTFVASKKDQEASINKIKKLEGLKYIFPGHGDCVPFTVDQI
ncbi:MAG: MBL fold metallo-hydrolase [Deltaproteobacteria bacterium]|nr:MBL fold metallo-hydrolase [Deltaproteobacteria bacterium]